VNLIAHLFRAIPLFGLAFISTLVAQLLWWRTPGSAAIGLAGFLLAFVYAATIAGAWFSPSRRVQILATCATVLVLGAPAVASIIAGRVSASEQFESLLVAVAFASVCWFTTQSLVKSRLAANYSLKRTAANRHGVN